ncbi:MAG TPA: RdgB/HAM1 family non-canonical purine NTP pyrophosphatase [Methanomassiliicoccales archaeon]|nr:RdgB/HAM1 family non-canonical purine NTP pyrophosphatase [Methanomassiliicoccales archaeon]
MVTSNQGKLKEFRHALEPLGFRLHHLPEDVDEIQADTLEEVVEACVRDLRARGIRDFVLDDSGLFVNALGGFPGVYSSYVFKTLGSEGILKLLEGQKDRRASFRCCIGCSVDGVGEFNVSQDVEGKIIGEKRGSGGFGFDPIFMPDGFVETFAEMPIDAKNRISHRGKAIKSFASTLSERTAGVDR